MLKTKIYKELIQLNINKTNNPPKQAIKKQMLKTQLKMTKGPDYPVFQEYVQMGSRYMNRSLATLIIRKMQIETTMKYHLTPVKMATIKKAEEKSVRDVEVEGILVCCWQECKLEQTWKAVWRFLKK